MDNVLFVSKGLNLIFETAIFLINFRKGLFGKIGIIFTLIFFKAFF